MNSKREQLIFLQGQLRAYTESLTDIEDKITLVEEEIDKLSAPELTDEQKAIQSLVCEDC